MTEGFADQDDGFLLGECVASLRGIACGDQQGWGTGDCNVAYHSLRRALLSLVVLRRGTKQARDAARSILEVLCTISQMP